MPEEIEAKIRVADHAPIRERLRALGATGGEVTRETNTFFDTPARDLLSRDEGLRLRHNARPSGDAHVVTYKGPKKAGAFKSREEVEFEVSDPAALRRVFAAMGYAPRLTFQKVRETYHLPPPPHDACHIELDTLEPHGTFVEVEGPDEATIRSVLGQLGLENAPLVKESYSKMMGGR